MDDLNLGKIITGNPGRDAIHIAVLPVIVAEFRIYPGTSVTFSNPDRHEVVTASDNNAIGIIDPFLTDEVKRGQKCWVFLYPNTVTGLRHHWEHPDIPEPQPEAEVDKNEVFRILKTGAEQKWLTTFANEQVNMSYPELMNMLDEYVRTGESHHLSGIDTPYGHEKKLWDCYEAVKGVKVPDRSIPFTCSC